MSKSIFLIISLFIAFFLSAKSTYATMCLPTFKFNSNVVVAEFSNYELDCKNRSNSQPNVIVIGEGNVKMHFVNLRNVLGQTPDNFTVEIYDSEKCIYDTDPQPNMVKVYKVFGDGATVLQPDKTYLLSIEKNKEVNYSIGGCGSIIQEVVSENDPIVTKTKFNIVKNNILLSGFSVAGFIDERTGKTGWIFLIAALLFYGLIIFILIKVIIFIIRKVRRRQRAS